VLTFRARHPAFRHRDVTVDCSRPGPVNRDSHWTASFDTGFAGMPTLTDLVNAMRPIEDPYHS
jgi:hypothetical protein